MGRKKSRFKRQFSSWNQELNFYLQIVSGTVFLDKTRIAGSVGNLDV